MTNLARKGFWTLNKLIKKANQNLLTLFNVRSIVIITLLILYLLALAGLCPLKKEFRKVVT